jgi:hypothetical protein
MHRQFPSRAGAFRPPMSSSVVFLSRLERLSHPLIGPPRFVLGATYNEMVDFSETLALACAIHAQALDIFYRNYNCILCIAIWTL